MESNQEESIVEFELPHKDRDKLKGYPEMIGKALPCRLIKVPPRHGDLKMAKNRYYAHPC